MPDAFRLISEYFWLACLAVTWFNARRAGNALDRFAELSDDQRQEAKGIVRRFALLATLPWLIVGAGQILGSTPSIWAYFRPQDGNPFVIAWLALVTLLNCALSGWLLLGGGARKVVDLKLAQALGKRHRKPPAVWLVKAYAVGVLAVVPLWIWGVIAMNAPIPR